MSRFVRVLSAILVVITAGAVQAHAGAPAALALEEITVADGLVTRMVSAPGDDTRLFVCVRGGRILILNRKTEQWNDDPFLDISDQITDQYGEQGLLGLAFHPDYVDNGRFFVWSTLPEGDGPGDTVLMEFQRDGDDPDYAEEQGERMLVVAQPAQHHHGGWMAFDGDGYLLLTTGDGGGGNGGPPRSQNITDGRLLGKMIRIDVDGDDFPNDSDRNYAIPPDNPFVDTEGDDEIWAIGLRNPWDGSIDPVTGDIFIGDVGKSAWEEVDVLISGTPGVANYGWRCLEGYECTGYSGCECDDPSLLAPLWAYEHSLEPERCSVIGAQVYRGCAMPSMEGLVVTTDMCSNELFLLDWSPAEGLHEVLNMTDELAGPSMSIPTVLGTDARGEIYIGQFNGAILKIVPVETVSRVGDINCDGVVDVTDLLLVIGSWGPCDGCMEDVDGDHQVAVTELLAVIADWG
jgi:glucose/arabinose dehydrogenase